LTNLPFFVICQPLKKIIDRKAITFPNTTDCYTLLSAQQEKELIDFISVRKVSVKKIAAKKRKTSSAKN